MTSLSIRNLIHERERGFHYGIPSFCSANRMVIDAILEEAKQTGQMALIEATSNQVNQEYGYMGLNSAGFRDYVYAIADKVGIDRNQIILGGDHLGPLPWKHLPAKDAMNKAEQLIRDSVAIGFQKIHIDTSMKLGDDVTLTDDIVAERGVRLYLAAEEAYRERLSTDPTAEHPVYIVGSEVPISGGAPEGENAGAVTEIEQLNHTLHAYRVAFQKAGVIDANHHTVAVVIQTGAEFGRDQIYLYDHQKALGISKKLEDFPYLVYEGHSTDYQPEERLAEMVQDGISILKVGPALTYALREALFALEMMEQELVDLAYRSNFRAVLDHAMNRNPEYWRGWYDGSSLEVELQTKYGFYDRCRYYFKEPDVQRAQETLFRNLDAMGIPLMMVHQFLPMEYNAVLEGRVELRAENLVKEHIKSVIRRYYRASALPR